MRVVVHDGDAASRAELLEPPFRSIECRERLRRRDRGNPERVGRGDRSGGISSVVRARQTKRYRYRRLERPSQIERHAVKTLHELDDAVSGLGRCSIGGDLASGEVVVAARGERGRVTVVGAGDEPAARHDPRREAGKRLLHVLVRREDVDVIVLDVRHDRDLGLEREERAVVFVRLDDEDVAASRVCVRTEVAQHGAADE